MNVEELIRSSLEKTAEDYGKLTREKEDLLIGLLKKLQEMNSNDDE